MLKCIYIRQNEALGLGHAVLCAKPAVGNNPFAVILADDMILSSEELFKSDGANRFSENLKSSIISSRKSRKKILT